MSVKCYTNTTFKELLWNFWVNIKRWSILRIYLFVLGGYQLQAHPTDASVIQLTLWHGVNPKPNRAVLQALVTKFNP